MSDRVRDRLADALPKWLSADRLLQVVMSSAIRNPKLLDCTQESILQCVMQCAQLGLEPMLGRAYLIPYKNSKKVGGQWLKVMECQMQVGYQGLIDLARRSGVIQDVYAAIVHEKDDFEFTLGTDRKIYHRPFLKGDPGKAIGVYAVWELSGGLRHPEFMSMYEIHKRRDRSQAWQYAQKNPNDKNAQDCPWIQWPNEMALKTVIKYSSKFVPASIDFMSAVQMDDDAEYGDQKAVSPAMPMLSAQERPELMTDAERFDDEANQLVMDQDWPAFCSFMREVADSNNMEIDKVKADIIENGSVNQIVARFKRQIPTYATDDMQKGESAEKQAENPLEDDSLWKNLKKGDEEKGTGFAKFVKDNAEFIPLISMETFNALDKKHKSLYGTGLPYDPDGDLIVGKEIAQGTEKDETCIDEIMQSPETVELAELSKKYPAAYSEVVQHRTPESIEQIKEWINDIKEMVRFTNEQF